MQRFGVVSLSWRQADASTLRQFTIGEESFAKRLPEIAAFAGVDELVYVSTCNRVEVIFAARPDVPMTHYRPAFFEALTGRAAVSGQAERTLNSWAGEGAVEHLFLVASGMDSAQIGETEITGQIRRSHQTSRELGLCGPRLNFLFDEALKTAAKVQQKTALNRGHVSLAEVALDAVKERLRSTPGRLALIGVSPMTERCAESLASLDIPVIVVNRSVDRAQALASKTGAQAKSLESFLQDPDRVEALISATGASDPVLCKQTLERLAATTPSGKPPLIVDMAIPRDVAPEDAAWAECPYIDMDGITAKAAEHRDERTHELADARELIDHSLENFRRKVADRRVSQLVGHLQSRYRETAREATQRLFKKTLSHLEDEERGAVERWAETLARRFAHIPVLGLRGLAKEGDSESIKVFVSSLEAPLADELMRAIDWADEPLSPKTDAEGLDS